MFLSGIGYDVHRLVHGRRLVLGGIEIPHSHGLDGHSDADVITHAISDALLGAAGDRDIGHHFPDSDPSIKGIDSQEILKRVQMILMAKQLAIVNIDCSVIAEAPKLSPHISAMRARLSATLGIPVERIGIKATTSEGLGFVGRGEGIAALAVVSLEKIEPRYPVDLPGPIV
ncbi:MAG: 2-C-methyl-D-erythritol 2,4-cyclodiphosphate synthase [Chthoniobacterales bacterium]|jgi:2-C-methyl-D-erythritol 2,4-cyclodiphosphate synthase